MKENKIINGNVTKSLINFTIPILFALFLQVMYGSIDMWVVGKFADISDISGVATGSQLMTSLTALCTGLAMGITVIIGNKVGENKPSEIGKIIANGIYLFSTLAIIIMIVLICFQNNIINILNTPTDAIEQTKGYIFYCTLGIPMIFAYNVLGSIFRGLGDSKTPLISVAIACVVNIIVDLILIWKLGLGAKGAAIATSLAQCISVIACIYIIRNRNSNIFKINKSDFKFNLRILNRIFAVGSPLALQGVLVSLSFLAVTAIVNRFGVLYSSSVGLTEKITGIIMLVPLAFMQSISVFSAQNFGANNPHRARKSMFVGIVISMSFGIVMAYLSAFHGNILIRLFNNNSELITTASEYLKAYSIDTFLVPITFCFTGYLNGRGNTLFVMIESIIGALLIRFPLAYIFSNITPVSLFTIGLAIPISTIVQLSLCIMFFTYLLKKEKNKLKDNLNS